MPFRSICFIAAISIISVGTSWAHGEDKGDEGPDEVTPAPESEEPGDVELGADAQSEEASDPVMSGEEEVGLDDAAEETDDIGGALGLTLLGVASVSGGILFFTNASATLELADAQIGSTDPNREISLRDRAEREETLGLVLTTLGVLMLGGAVYLWVDDASAMSDDVGDVAFAPTLRTDGGAGVSVSGVF
jgi:hypothetical protein